MVNRVCQIICLSVALIILSVGTVVPVMADGALNGTSANTIYMDLSKYDKPITKEQFYKINDDYYQYISGTLGEKVATMMMDNEYSRISAGYASKLERDSNVKSIENNVLTYSPGDSQVSVLLGENANVYFWPYVHSAQVTDASNAGPVGLFFSGWTKNSISDMFKWTGVFHDGTGTSMNGLRGSSPSSMSWGNVDVLGQLESGSFFGQRYHFVLIPGHSSSNEYTYGDCHWEQFQLFNPGTGGFEPDHYGVWNSYELGQQYVNQVIDAYPSIFWPLNQQEAYLGNTYGWYSDGWATQYF